jgi:hypothetical protein
MAAARTLAPQISSRSPAFIAAPGGRLAAISDQPSAISNQRSAICQIITPDMSLLIADS